MEKPIPIWQRVLWVLWERKSAHPDAPLLEPFEIIAALELPPNQAQVYTALSRLADDRLVSRRRVAGRHKYAITPAGIQAAERAPSTRPWGNGTVVATARASYRILEQLRPVGRLPSARVEVFKAAPTVSRADQALAGRPVVIKTIPNHQVEHLRTADAYDRATYMRELNDVFESEIQKISTAPGFSRVARTLDWGRETLYIPGRTPLHLPFVVQEHIEGPDLPGYFARGIASPFTGLSSLEQWFELAEWLAEGLKEVHAAGAFHRHIWPGTIFMRQEGPVFVDLIEAVFHVPSWPVGSLELPLPEDPRVKASSPAASESDAFVAPEWRIGKRLEPRRTADLYSLGAVLYYAATGRTPNFDIQDREALKKAVVQALQGSIAADNYGVADIISRCLRFSPDDRVSDTYTLLSDIRLFRGTPRTLQVGDALTLVTHVNHIAESQQGGVFASLAAVELEQFERAIAELTAGSLTVGEGHDNLVVKLCSYLSTLGEGDEYWAVTLPDFWRAENLGLRGRYLSMNAEIVRRGATVLRVFLLTDDDLRRVEVRAIIDAQREIERDIVKKGSKIKGSLVLRYLRVTEAQRQSVCRQGQQVGLWVRGDSLVEVRPIYNSKGVINRVTIRRLESSRADMEHTWFDRFFKHKDALPLKAWGSD